MNVTHYYKAELGIGSLVLEYTVRQPNYYSDSGRAVSPTMKFYFEAGRRTILREISEIASVAGVAGVLLSEAVHRQPREYAEILSAYRGLGVVVRDSPRFGYLDSILDGGHWPRAPRVAGESLEFLTVDARLPELKVRLIRWDLRDLTYSCDDVPIGSTLLPSP